MFGFYFFYAFLALLIIFGLYTYKNLSNALLWQVPGPIIARLTPLYRVYLLWSGDCTQKFERLHQRFGPVVRTGPHHVITSDPAAILTIYDAGWQYPKVKRPDRQNVRIPDIDRATSTGYLLSRTMERQETRCSPRATSNTTR